MRTFAPALGLVFVVAIAASSPVALAQPRTPAPRPDDLARARTLAKEGEKAYGDGRYNDAIRFYEEAHRLGAPPFMLWNIAKCHVRLDQPEQAAEMLERYLAIRELPADDREEATQQLAELRKRPSTVTIGSTPSGATVAVDGRTLDARTPTSTTLPPGNHTLTLTLPTYTPYTRDVEAKYGRAIIVDAPLAKDRRPPPPENPYGEGEVKRVALRGTMGVVLPRYGSVGGRAHFGFSMSGVYRFLDVGATAFGVGGMLSITGDSWQNTINAPSTGIPPCGALSDFTSATALSIFAIGTAGWEIVPRLRLHAIGGLGLATYFAGEVGGDLFAPSCSASPGARPAFLLGSQLDFAVTPIVRITLMPITLQLQPAFGGARSTPLDATGLWLRTTIALGAGVDF